MPTAGVDLIGSRVVVKSLAQETLLDIARQFDLGQKEILLANPNVDRWMPGEDTDVTLPGRFILPRAKRKGVVLNLLMGRIRCQMLFYQAQTTPLDVMHCV